ncbi:hypothetical protein GY45DRAFT_1316491 [Cubamyces sp. BRFM 1775]|nr:hypothetical protein GY45DRAFT_1316491 [Cubamyces sp. BRFM 1775]
MNAFSRIIARPFFAPQRPLDVKTDDAMVPQAFPQPVYTEHRSPGVDNNDLLQKLSAARISTWEDEHKNKTKPCGDSGNPYLTEGFVKPFPRLFALARTDSLRSLPSLCSDDGHTESTRSISPVVFLQSPPPTGSSTMAVLGSPGFMTGFGDEFDHPEDDPDFVRNELRKSRSLRRQARMRDGDFRLTDDERDFSVTNEPVAPPRPPRIRPVNKNVAHMRGGNGGGTGATKKYSRLNQRVKAPPALNTAAIRAYALLSKLMRGTYDIEVRDVDGSTISDIDSGFEADDEGDFDLPDNTVKPQASFYSPNKAAGPSVTTDDTDTGRVAGCAQAPAKRTYAAVVSATSETSSVPVTAGSVKLEHAQKAADWSDMFAQKGPFVEILDL